MSLGMVAFWTLVTWLFLNAGRTSPDAVTPSERGPRRSWPTGSPVARSTRTSTRGAWTRCMRRRGEQSHEKEERNEQVEVAGGRGRGSGGHGRSHVCRVRQRRLARPRRRQGAARSEEHTSEHQSLMRISYAVFCVK